jgi:hypothetical protein
MSTPFLDIYGYFAILGALEIIGFYNTLAILEN